MLVLSIYPHVKLSAVNLNKDAPKPYCCISDENDARRGLVGFFYEVSSGPIIVLDSKTFLIPNFRFQGSIPPDGWIFSGKGDIDKATGKIAYVIGRDTAERYVKQQFILRHCPLREDYDGRKELIVRLANDQTVYDINYISVFCYEFAVDFGHVVFDMRALQVAVPAYIPPVQQHANIVHAQAQC
uniref:DM13 domain-containing protein n=1 Tax=Parascaris equorum TaxID=6256 RepID=A0A914RHM1_PAREQ